VTCYYVLAPARPTAHSLALPRRQVKGSLPTYGLCAECFIRVAKRMGMNSAELKQLRQLLQLRG
jgi:hypothetical protein